MLLHVFVLEWYEVYHFYFYSSYDVLPWLARWWYRVRKCSLKVAAKGRVSGIALKFWSWHQIRNIRKWIAMLNTHLNKKIKNTSYIYVWLTTWRRFAWTNVGITIFVIICSDGLNVEALTYRYVITILDWRVFTPDKYLERNESRQHLLIMNSDNALYIYRYSDILIWYIAALCWRCNL